MDLRSLPPNLGPHERCNERRKRIEEEVSIDLSALSIEQEKLGCAEEKNCEQMFGHIPIPVGYAGPLPVQLSSGETIETHLPLATTEGALVASINRGCKAVRLAGGVTTQSIYHGITRSIAFRRIMVSVDEPSRQQSYRSFVSAQDDTIIKTIKNKYLKWKSVGEKTSNHLKILKYEIDTTDDLLYLTIFADTDEAMGMNMVTIAAEAIAKWMEEHLDLQCITIAANVDSDKKPSMRTRDRGRGYEVVAEAIIPSSVIEDTLKTTPEALLHTAHTKLDIGSELAGALGSNCHAANIIAALYLATGQDIAHVVEGSLTDTHIEKIDEGIRIRVRLPALLVGVRGGGTTLPAQSQALRLLLSPITYHLSPRQQLAEMIAAAVLAGELSLIAALSANHLAEAHKNHARQERVQRA